MTGAEQGAEGREKLAALRRRREEIDAEIAALERRLGSAPVSPLAPARFPEVASVAGVSLAAAAAGVKYAGRNDVMLARLEPGTRIAGVFTRSATRSAPVLWCEERVAALSVADADRPLAILVNSGNANAFTGRNGAEAVETLTAAAGETLGTDPGAVLVASTGVIGEPLPADRIRSVLDEARDGLDPQAWEPAARAIMTTDTFPKAASAGVIIDGVPVTISGIAKGSGMIAPDMATMLAFVFTDAGVAPELLQAMLREATERSFNAITVDGDTSTSDTLLLAATGRAGMAPIESTDDPRAGEFLLALEGVLRDLALQVVRDGEGASRLAEIHVSGAETDASAKRIGLAIANSPLVKTALAGGDPNWGRIVMAVGKAGEPADRDRLSIRFGDVAVAEAGWVAPGYREEDGAAEFAREEVSISVDIGVGSGSATVWTCDLTKAYVSINADYRS